MNKTPKLIGFGALALTLILDLFSKNAILAHFINGGEAIPLTSFLNLILTWNKGVSFGFLAAGTLWSKLALVALALTICIVLAIWLWRSASKIEAMAFGMIIGGALGNVYDRLLHGAVVDFIDTYAFGYHWYTFNIADCGITLGAVILVLQQLFIKNENHN